MLSDAPENLGTFCCQVCNIGTRRRHRSARVPAGAKVERKAPPPAMVAVVVVGVSWTQASNRQPPPI
eukprot:11165808-Lingulodinium_polyedra.AAC.1